jgi:hypothetical protein
MNYLQIKNKANELIESYQKGGSLLAHMLTMGEWAAGLSDPDRPQLEKIAGGYKITYNGIDYQAKGGFISVMAPQEVNGKSLAYDIQKVINRHSLENQSNTPDYALSAFILQMLVAFSQAVKQRDAFHEAVMSPAFKSGGFIPSTETGLFTSEEGPEKIITTPPDITDPATFKENF